MHSSNTIRHAYVPLMRVHKGRDCNRDANSGVYEYFLCAYFNLIPLRVLNSTGENSQFKLYLSEGSLKKTQNSVGYLALSQLRVK
jgi:hypothetical protein